MHTQADLKTACFIDFDHTIFDTDAFYHVELRKKLGLFEVPDELWEEIYWDTIKGGWPWERHLLTVINRSAALRDLECCKERTKLAYIRSTFAEMEKELPKFVFPDVIPFLEKTQAVSRLFILTRGQLEWQKYKIDGCGLKEYFERVLIADKRDGKADIIQWFVKNRSCRAVFIDNNPYDLDLVKGAFPAVETYMINRVPDELMTPEDRIGRLRFLEAREIAKRPSKHEHIKRGSLDEIKI